MATKGHLDLLLKKSIPTPHHGPQDPPDLVLPTNQAPALPAPTLGSPCLGCAGLFPEPYKPGPASRHLLLPPANCSPLLPVCLTLSWSLLQIPSLTSLPTIARPHPLLTQCDSFPCKLHETFIHLLVCCPASHSVDES